MPKQSTEPGWLSALHTPDRHTGLEEISGPVSALTMRFVDVNGVLQLKTDGSIYQNPRTLEENFYTLDLRKYKLFVFDVDGLLVDSERVTLECIILAAEQMAKLDLNDPNFTFSVEQVKKIQENCFKRPEPDMAEQLRMTLSLMGLISDERNNSGKKVFYDSLIELRKKIYEEKVEKGEIKLMPGAIEILSQLNAFNATTALYTGNSEPFIDILIEKIFKKHIKDFDAFIPRHHRFYGSNLPVGYTKPHPFACSHICQRLGIDPLKAVMFEDRLSGVNSAFGAGYGRMIIVPEDQNSFPFVNPKNDLSIPNLFKLYSEFEDTYRDPNRFKILPGLDRIMLIGPDGQEWFPSGYEKQKAYWDEYEIG